MYCFCSASQSYYTVCSASQTYYTVFVRRHKLILFTFGVTNLYYYTIFVERHRPIVLYSCGRLVEHHCLLITLCCRRLIEHHCLLFTLCCRRLIEHHRLLITLYCCVRLVLLHVIARCRGLRYSQPMSTNSALFPMLLAQKDQLCKHVWAAAQRIRLL